MKTYAWASITLFYSKSELKGTSEKYCLLIFEIWSTKERFLRNVKDSKSKFIKMDKISLLFNLYIFILYIKNLITIIIRLYCLSN